MKKCKIRKCFPCGLLESYVINYPILKFHEIWCNPEKYHLLYSTLWFIMRNLVGPEWVRPAACTWSQMLALDWREKRWFMCFSFWSFKFILAKFMDLNLLINFKGRPCSEGILMVQHIRGGGLDLTLFSQGITWKFGLNSWACKGHTLWGRVSVVLGLENAPGVSPAWWSRRFWHHSLSKWFINMRNLHCFYFSKLASNVCHDILNSYHSSLFSFFKKSF